MADIKRLLLKSPEVYGNLNPLACCKKSLPSIPSEQTTVRGYMSADTLTKQILVVLRLHVQCVQTGLKGAVYTVQWVQ